MSTKVLIVEDEAPFRASLVSRLKAKYEVIEASNADECLRRMSENPNVVLLDVNIPPKEGRPPDKLGIGLVPMLMRARVDVHVIVMTGTWEDIEHAVLAMKRGADNFIPKRKINDDPAFLLRAVSEALDPNRLADTLIGKSSQLEPSTLEDLAGWSPSLKKVLNKAKFLAQADCDILILGETGVGKTMIARAIHLASRRFRKAFERFDCTQLSGDFNTGYTQLFGAVSGFFNSRFQKEDGLFRRNDRGTLLLDEVGLVPHELQGRLLSVIEDREVRPIGSDQKVRVDVRVLYATDKNLDKENKERRLLPALLGRLERLPRISVPPLRERRDDIKQIVVRFLQKINEELGTQVSSISDEALDTLQNERWPRNFRQLNGVLVNAVVAAAQEGEESLCPHHLSLVADEDQDVQPPAPDKDGEMDHSTGTMASSIQDLGAAGDLHISQSTRKFVETFIQCGGNLSEVAKALKLSRSAAHIRIPDCISAMVKELARFGGNIDAMAEHYQVSSETLRRTFRWTHRFSQWIDDKLIIYRNDWRRMARTLDVGEEDLQVACKRIKDMDS